jgi:outer membrane immunogenic protein
MHRFFAALISAVSAALVSQVAWAADMPVKAPAYTPAPAPVFSWTGFYVGGNAGYSWGNAKFDMLADTAFFPVTGPALAAASLQTLHPNGFTGGVGAGYNWQNGWLVLGLETDFNYIDLKESLTVTPISPVVGAGTFFTESVKTNWLFTLRGRGGVSVQRTLIYVTGGLAVARVQYSDVASFVAAGGGLNAASGNSTRSGWTLGGGVEQALGNGWSAKAEYLYTDLGKTNYTSSSSVLAAATILHTHDFNFNTVRVGLNYSFNSR